MMESYYLVSFPTPDENGSSALKVQFDSNRVIIEKVGELEECMYIHTSTKLNGDPLTVYELSFLELAEDIMGNFYGKKFHHLKEKVNCQYIDPLNLCASDIEPFLKKEITDSFKPVEKL